MNTLQEIMAPWFREDGSDDLLRLSAQVEWMRRHLYEDYEPAGYRRFDERLADWLLNLEDEDDRKTMFRLLGHLFFVGKRQFEALCRSTFNDAVTRWLLDLHAIPLGGEDAEARLGDAVRTTWFNSVSDSMNLNTFVKTNRLAGHGMRPDWRTLNAFGDRDNIRRHVRDSGIGAIVLLEDFVGSGEQMRNAVRGLREVLPDTPLLVAPLVCCPDGVVEGEHLAKLYDLSFQPTMSLREDTFLLPGAQPEEPALFGELRDLILRIRDRLGEWSDEPFGHHQTGGMVTMFTNCPDNSLPIIHEQNARWNALFPRVRRE